MRLHVQTGGALRHFTKAWRARAGHSGELCLWVPGSRRELSECHAYGPDYSSPITVAPSCVSEASANDLPLTARMDPTMGTGPNLGH